MHLCYCFVLCADVCYVGIVFWDCVLGLCSGIVFWDCVLGLCSGIVFWVDLVLIISSLHN
jgi:hypothetical protein